MLIRIIFSSLLLWLGIAEQYIITIGFMLSLSLSLSTSLSLSLSLALHFSLSLSLSLSLALHFSLSRSLLLSRYPLLSRSPLLSLFPYPSLLNYLGPGEKARIYCYSAVEKTTWNRTCEPIPPDNEYKTVHHTCMTVVSYTDKPQQRTCRLKNNLNLTIPLLILPRGPSNNRTVQANSTNFRCIVEQDKSELQAGHLLSTSFNIIKNDTRNSGENSKGSRDNNSKYVTHKMEPQNNFSLVKQHPIWEMKVDETFTCNGTTFELKVVFQCLQILPSGWPSFTNCKIFHKIGITIGVIVAFVIAYVTLCVGLCQMLSLCKSKKVMKA